MLNRVVVTGFGAITPLGNKVDEFWKSIVAGKSGASPITRFDASRFRTTFACEIRDYDPSYLDRNDLKRTDLFTSMVYFQRHGFLSCKPGKRNIYDWFTDIKRGVY